MKKFQLPKLLPVLLSGIIFFTANAQKLPNVQQTSLRAPADLKIDGKANEWNNRFQAYNDTTHVYYTVANDDKNLYLTLQASDPAIINMILTGGVTFSINRAGEKELADAANITYPDLKDATYPTLKKENMMSINFSDIKVRQDSFAMANNSQLAARSKYISVNGINSLAELTSINNRDGIKAVSLFDNKMVYTYELAVDLSLLGLDMAKPERFAYNIAVGEGRYNPIVFFAGARPIHISYTPFHRPPSPDNPHGYIPADFWGEYTLAKQ